MKARQRIALACVMALLPSQVFAQRVSTLPADAPMRSPEKRSEVLPEHPEYAPVLRRPFSFEPPKSLGVPLLCAGAVMGLMAGTMAILAKHSWDKFNAYPTDPPLSRSAQLGDLQQLRSRARLETTLAWVSGAAGLVGLVGGFWIWKTGKTTDSDENVSMVWKVQPGAVSLQGRFR